MMLVVGLTGSIGMGKSTAAARLKSHGIAVFDADAAVHALYSGKAVPLVETAFPGSTRDGVVDREALTRLLAGSRDQFAKLEAIVHPLVQAEERVFLQAEQAGGAAVAVLEIPLLFETGLDQKVDVTIVVSAPGDVQRARVLERPGMTAERFESIIALQVPDAEKRARADFVVDTSGSIEASGAQIDDIVEALGEREETAFERYWLEPASRGS
ncbi:MAG: dephospho-CoA kinase [Hyphomicrobiaceae bacterium]